MSVCFDNEPRFIPPISTGFPKITYDLNLGNDVDYIDCNEKAIADYMRSRDFTDQDIEKTTIHFSSDMPLAPDGSKRPQHGDYCKTTDEIVVFPLNYIALGSAALNLEPDIDRHLLMRWLKTNLSETIVHELGHKEIANDPEVSALYKQWTNKTARRELLATYGAPLSVPALALREIHTGYLFADCALIGASAIAAYSGWLKLRDRKGQYKQRLYDNDPEERTCYALQEIGPRDLVTIAPKAKEGSQHEEPSKV